MSPKVEVFGKVNIESLTLSVPEKHKGRYISFISYQDGKPLYLQSNPVTLHGLDPNSVTLGGQSSGDWSDTLQHLRAVVLERIFDNHVEFFRGKRYTREYLNDALKNALDEQGKLTCAARWDSLQIRDQFGRPLASEELQAGSECIALLLVKSVSFTANVIKIDVELQQLKVYNDLNLKEWSILTIEDSDAPQAHPVESEDEAPREVNASGEPKQDEEKKEAGAKKKTTSRKKRGKEAAGLAVTQDDDEGTVYDGNAFFE